LDTSLSESYLDFNFNNLKIRVLTDENKVIWFVAKDVAQVLGYVRKKDNKVDVNAMTRKIGDEDKGTTNIRTLGGMQQMAIINESGLYIAIFGSTKDEAIQFKYWVTRDVLPQIRKTGSYQIQPTQKSLKQKVEDLELAVKHYENLEKMFKKFGNFSKKELAEKTSNSVFLETGIDFLKMFGGFPKEEKHSFQNSFSLTSLLEKHNIQIQTSKFNLKLEKLGIIEKKGKNWFILNLDFGINENYQNDNNPRYFEDNFEKLINLVYPPKEICEMPTI